MALTKDFTGALQKALNEKNYGLNGAPALLTVDGIWGRATERSLKYFQQVSSIPQTGAYDTATIDKLDSFIRKRYILDSDIIAAAESISVDPNMLKAVIKVETKDSGFFPNGHPTILFERHIFRRELAKVTGATALAELERKFPHIVNKSTGGYQANFLNELARLNQARGINNEAALKSASWGIGQVMGFNFAVAGVSSVFELVEQASLSEKYQLNHCIGFIKTNGLVKHMQKKDYTAFARGYNGINQKGYDERIKAEYEKLTRT